MKCHKRSVATHFEIFRHKREDPLHSSEHPRPLEDVLLLLLILSIVNAREVGGCTGVKSTSDSSYAAKTHGFFRSKEKQQRLSFAFAEQLVAVHPRGRRSTCASTSPCTSTYTSPSSSSSSIVSARLGFNISSLVVVV